MVKYQRKNLYNHLKKSKEYVWDEAEEYSCLKPFGLNCGNSAYSNKRVRTKIFYFIFIFLVSYSLILASHFLSFNPTLSLLYSFGVDNGGLGSETDVNAPLCSSVPQGTICCDRCSIRSDVCIMKGDVRTHSTSSSIVLYTTDDLSGFVSGLSDDGVKAIIHEKIRPYSRKWETNVMDTIDELNLVLKRNSNTQHKCDVHHNVTAIFFSTGGYTGNLYHEFNDGILPLYITSHHLTKKVVFVLLEYHDWWMTKYGDILSQLSDYPAIDFSGDKRVHCFDEAIVGLKIHDELTIDASLMEGNKTIIDFHDLLNRAYWPRINGLIEEEEKIALPPLFKNAILETTKGKRAIRMPKLVIVSRNGSRSITNEDSLVKMAEEIGFFVEVLRPQRTTELAKIYRVLNSSDVMIGVHGAAMTHFLFMKPTSVFIQVIPLGTEWAAETYYGEPAKKLDLNYIGYKILDKESSLYDDYDENDPILINPTSVNSKGWEFTKKIYLDKQTVRLDLSRFRKVLLKAYQYIARKNKNGHIRLRKTKSHIPF